jgi:hypothetical protein
VATHTPGPWMVEPHSDEDETLYVCADYTLTPEGFARATWIAECDLQDGNLEENGANARLIAAAPELLRAARALAAMRLWVLSYDGTVFDKPRLLAEINLADAAIAKAEGR